MKITLKNAFANMHSRYLVSHNSETNDSVLRLYVMNAEDIKTLDDANIKCPTNIFRDNIRCLFVTYKAGNILNSVVRTHIYSNVKLYLNQDMIDEIGYFMLGLSLELQIESEYITATDIYIKKILSTNIPF